MKRFLHFILIVGLLSGCVDAEIDEARQSLSSVMPNVINISLDDDTTRVQLNASGKTVWTEDDCVSAFYMSDANNKFRFNGETGDRDGKFVIESMGTATADIDNIVLLYPYSSSYKLNAAKSQIDVYIPSTQYYEAGSYGVGVNIMASVETDDDFTLKSLCGWIVVQLKGDATITNITLSGNNGEQLAGDADFDYADFNLTLVYYPNGSNIYGDSNVGGSLVWGDCLESITLDCGDGIALNPDKPTEFYFVVPPQKFTKGITIEAECLRGEPIVKSSSKALTVQRNHIVPMSTITANEVIPNNQIWYTSSDGEVVEPDDDTAFGATLLSNTYVNGIGVITFNGEATTIGEYAFSYCESLTSITIPDSVTTIGDYAFEGCTSLTSVTIGDNVTTIGDYAFYECTSLTSITIPDSVTTIGDMAFSPCNSLTAFYGKFASEDNRCLIIDGVLSSFAPSELTQYTIPDSVTTVGYCAFYGCDNLTSVTIPDSVITIGDGAFNACNGLTEITIPDGVTSIGYAAFMGCEGLMYATIPASVTQIGEGAFAYCESLTSVFCKATTPPSVDDGIFLDNAAERKIYVLAEAVDAYKLAKGWSDYADYIIGYDFEKGEIFAKQKLVYTSTSIVSPDSTDFGDANIMYNNFDATTGIGVIGFDREVTSIGEGTFSYCESLTSVTIPDSVTTIGEGAFKYCYSLTSITIPDSVTSIGKDAFHGCDSLTSVIIGNGLTTIEKEAFAFCDSLTSVIIGNGLTTIEKEAFAFCTSLTSVTIPDSVTSIGENAFYSCDSLTSVTIPDGVTEIGYGAFADCDSLTSVTIPDSVTSIGDAAFSGCTSLTSVTIGNGVTTIGDSVFSYCTSLASITIPDSITEIGNDVFRNCDSLISVTIPDSVTAIREKAFYSCDALTSVTIGNGVTTIGQEAFRCCDSLESFYSKFASEDNRCLIVDGELIAFAPAGLIEYTIPDSVTSIGDSAFSDCSSLTSVTIGNGVTSIGDFTFCYCDSLTSVTIGNSVTTIGSSAFFDCTSLTSVTIGNSVTTIGRSAFSDCTSLTSITIPDSVTSIGNYAFRYCTSLTSVTIGDNVAEIGQGAFYKCSSLTSITIPDSVTSIGNYAFYDCNSLTSVYCKATTPPTAFYEDEDWQDWDAFGDNAQNRKIYVPAEAVDTYKSAKGWKNYANNIEDYEF